MRVSAYIPCYNSEATIGNTLRSLREQSLQPDELFVVDDGSTDGSDKIPDVKIFRLGSNQGRGAARSKAMQESRYELVLGCDASLVLDRSFLSRAVTWFEDETVAAVFGRITEAGSPTAPNRWRDRHLFRSDMAHSISWEMPLASGCFVVRKSAVENIGGFNAGLRSREDIELGQRLRGAGYSVVFDPRLFARSISNNKLLEVLERYARWNTPKGMRTWDYLRQINYALKVMVAADLKAGDPAAACISLLCPHYQFWKRR
jgi:glycosyltransferase involved in cell wall biosynthesis